MHIKRNLRKITNAFLGEFGYEIRRVPKHNSGTATTHAGLTLGAALSRLIAKSLEINTVIDIGASDGQWSMFVQRYYPKAYYFLIEANPVYAERLRSFKEGSDNVDYVLAAAGDVVGELYFDDADPSGGLASHLPLAGHCIRVPATTVDTQVQQRQLAPPFLLKLDTHGFEVPILDGSQQTLNETNSIVMETYNFNVTSDSLRFWEMCSLLESKGFRPIDLCDPLYRPKDQAFWQADLFFVPSGREEFKSNDYS